MINPFKYAAKLFSNDPSASCSRLLAALCLVYVIIYGSLYFSTLTDIQTHYLLGILGGVLPYAFSKISDLRKPPDGMV